ncbi:formate dehydrogenase beta subunit [Roseospira navarrensis]|uniref:Formate dehydrogenase n=1 Tax=Roseospira navarrensis TaxID=140058 RepID=A0A7X1ZCE8_9PROT|nr:formate dehydrogenase beta subunit [Roseospira navarrensis]MQX34966.1 formate dehydrogenase [Roseospira navarrensis]
MTAAALRVFVPRDSAALSVGADEVAAAIQAEATRRGVALTLVRPGSRGMLWLEPLVEVERPDGTRHAFGPVTPEDVPALFDAGFPAPDTAHLLALGPTDQIPYLKDQQRITFSRCGVIDPLSVDDYRDHGGFEGVTRALAMPPEDICRAVTDSGLRGRGGAGFPAGIKWDTVRKAPGPVKTICCNADEGDSGTFADRMLMEGDPFLLIEGMVIAGLAVGAAEGFVYIRSEYPHAIATMRAAIGRAEQAGWLGDSLQGTDQRFHLQVRVGAGAYICGEETAMLESLEGRRGQVRAKPPLPALEGLFGTPTVVNNVLTLAAVPTILARGGDYYATFGVGRSRGTQPFQLAGNVKRGGLVEVPFGISLHDLVYRFGGGTASGRPVRAVQVGGPLGAYLPESLFHLPQDYEAFAAVGAMVGHGGIVVFDDTVDMAAMARFAMAFCAIESCGKCTPCRIGSQRGVEVIDRIVAGIDRDANLALLDDLCAVMAEGSLCAMGGLTPQPVQSALRHFPEDFDRPPLGAAAE